SEVSMPATRREFLTVAGTLAAGAMTAYAHADESASPHEQRERRMPTRVPVKVMASHNGLEATKKAYELIEQGSDPLDAVVSGVALVEADPNDTTVGYGGLPNEDGIVELDAAVMHGPTHRAGAVAALRNIRHPAEVARLVMRRSDHVLLVGEGALRFARAFGFQEEDLLTERARKIWLYWKQTLSPKDDWLPPSPDEIDPEVAEFFKLSRRPMTPEEKSEEVTVQGRKWERPTGTIHCAAITAAGDLSCTTSTSGLAFKIPGRVGDSPIIGAGLYCDNEIGSCGSTGRGEANLQNLCSFAAVELMRNGLSPKDAGMDILRRVSKTAEDRLRDKQGRPDFGLKFYLLAKDGRHAGVSMWGPADFAVTDETGARHEECVFLYEKNS
ncbi:MAG: N(4)-(beta-N-acetylglucosaminyl)-L-asparaginase, partial [Planctomycetaceae bacterium]